MKLVSCIYNMIKKCVEKYWKLEGLVSVGGSDQDTAVMCTGHYITERLLQHNHQGQIQFTMHIYHHVFLHLTWDSFDL